MDEEYAVVLIDGEAALGKGFVNDISYVKYSWDGAALTSAEVTTGTAEDS